MNLNWIWESAFIIIAGMVLLRISGQNRSPN